MKEFYITLMVVLVAIVAGTTTASAYDFVQGGIYYNILEDDETSVEVTFCDEDDDECVDEGKGYVGELVIPKNVTYAGKSYSVKGIGENAFWEHTELTSVKIPEGVEYINSYAFQLPTIKSITLPSTLEIINYYAFYECTNLTSIVIPKNVSLIDDCAFGYCYNLKSIVVEEGNSVYDSRGGCNAIIETATNTLVAGCLNTVIPNTVKIIGVEAFCGIYSELEDVEISIPYGVTELKTSAFAECTFMSKISLPSTLTEIGSTAFSNCVGLKEIVCSNATPPAIEKGVVWDDEKEEEYEVIDTFDGVPEDARLIVPAGAAEAYANADGWDRFAGYIEEDDTLTGVESVIAGENAPVEYYNLQGVKVARPENGIFIRKQGTKTTKVVL